MWLRRGWKTGHTQYVERVKSEFREGIWLDAGGGHQIFHDHYDGEATLVDRSKLVVVCDYDQKSLSEHVSCTNRVRCDLNLIPLISNTFDFVTCGMVVEHLNTPMPTIQELARVLKPGGIMIIHTVNLYGYPTQTANVSKIIPSRIRRRMIAALTKRREEDIFPTFYRFNTASSMRKILCEAGLEIKTIEYLPAGVLFGSVPVIRGFEVIWVNCMLKFSFFHKLLPQLLLIATKAIKN